MFKKIVISIVLVLLVIFLSKDYLAKAALNQILTKKFKLESQIGECKVNFLGINLAKAKVSSESFILKIPRLKARLKGFQIKKIMPPAFALKLNLPDIAVSLAAEDIDFKGVFSDELILGLGPKSAGTLEGSLTSMGPGEINIKKDTALGGLKSYLDEPSYETLLASFKNYSYDSGRITITKSQGVISIGLNFDSSQSGKRNITLSLYQN